MKLPKRPDTHVTEAESWRLLQAIAPTVLRMRGDRKRLLVSAPSHPLPPEVLERRKSGFTLPVKKWMNTERRRFGMRDWALELLRDEFLQRPVEIISGCKSVIDKFSAKDLASDAKPLFEHFLIHGCLLS